MQPFRAGKPVQCPACRRQNARICVQVLPALCGGYSGKNDQAAQKEYPGLPVVCAGGVMSSDIIRAWVQKRLPQVYFVPGQYSSDNAIGVSILAAREAGLWLK